MLSLELGTYWSFNIAPGGDRKRKKRKIRDLDLGIIPQNVIVKEVKVNEKGYIEEIKRKMRTKNRTLGNTYMSVRVGVGKRIQKRREKPRETLGLTQTNSIRLSGGGIHALTLSAASQTVPGQPTWKTIVLEAYVMLDAF